VKQVKQYVLLSHPIAALAQCTLSTSLKEH
jgi:hypothetical protein